MKIRERMIRRLLIAVALSLALIFGFGITQTSRADSIPSRVESAVQWAISTANDDSHGYTLNPSMRWGPDYDCGTFIVSAFTNGGGFSFSGFVGTKSMLQSFTNAGFTWIPASQLGITLNNVAPASLQRGDILLDMDRHTELYLGNGMTAAAHSDRGHPETGDQTGTEVSVAPYYNGVSGISWDGVLRYTGSSSSNSGNSSSNSSNSSGTSGNSSNSGSNSSGNSGKTSSRISLKSVTAYNKTYTGKSQSPSLVIYDANGKRVTSGYSVKTSGSLTNAGTVKVTVKGVGAYTGTVKTTYRIYPKNASSAVIAAISAKTYTGKTIVPNASVRLNGVKLKKNRDYTLSAVNKNTKGVLTANFCNNYTGKVSRSFTIKKAALTSSNVKLESSKVQYTGSAQEPAVKVSNFQKGTDYTVTCTNNINAGKATMKVRGCRMVTGSVTKTFSIVPKTLESDDIQVAETVYNGSEQEPEVTAAGLTKGKDYQLYRSDSDQYVNAGTYTIILRGINNYTGDLNASYVIQPRSLKDVRTSGLQNFTYNGKNQKQNLLTLTFERGNALAPITLTAGTDYTESCSSGFKTIGKKKLILTGTGNYKDKISLKYYVRPKTPSVKFTSLYGGLKITAGKVSGSPQYQISIRKNGSKSWKTYALGTSRVSSLTSLGRGKTYQIRVRAYKDGAYSSWSTPIYAVTK
ncbi:MAG: fibronectin type III domain-containing protein [Eubacterium sp.]